MTGAPWRRVAARFLRNGIELEELSCGHVVTAPDSNTPPGEARRICPRCSARAAGNRAGLRRVR